MAKLIDLWRPEIEKRIASGWIIEGHGDLRPEHVCLLPRPVIIDCLEFDRRMRILDPYDEVNFLGLECAMHGADWVGPLLLQTLEQRIGHAPPPGLLSTYTAFRAVLRARLCIAHLLDSSPMTPERWPRETRAYLAVAREACAKADDAGSPGD